MHVKMISRCADRLIALPAFRGRDRMLNVLSPFVQHAKSVYGPRMLFKPFDLTNKACLYGYYGHRISNHISNLAPDSVFVDIGANAGIFSLLASRVLSDGFVLSFEPNPFVFQDLVQNISLNDCKSVFPFCVGIGDQSAVSRISFTISHSGASHICEDGEDSIPILLLSVGDLKMVFELAAKREINIKIDAEGFEFNILQSLKDTDILRRTRSIIIEISANTLSRYGHFPANIYEFLVSNRFSPTFSDATEHYDEIFVRS